MTAAGRGGESQRQIRGSSLLLTGRLLSMVVNLATQVLIVRYLTQASYGAFAYALSIAHLGETVVTLGLDRAVTRFVPIYEERRQFGRLLGTLLLVVGTILSLGLAVILLVLGLQGFIGDRLITDRDALPLLVILIVLAPIQALDALSIGMFAVFGKPRAIFFRRYVIAPGFRLVVVLLLVLQQADVRFLAIGYVAAGGVTLVIYGYVLFRAMRERGLLKPENVSSIQVPAREIFAFTLPLLTSDLVYTVMNVSDAVMLGYYSGTAEVAAYRAVQPAARLNQLVMSSFALLFTPLAARMFAREDHRGVDDLYWHTAAWLAVLSFPVFALTFSMAGPVTVALFDQRYASSSVYLALLSLGYYVQAASGFNGLTLKVFGKLRYVVVVNLLAALTNVLGNFLLIPRYGALGAAISTCGALVTHNFLKQAGLRLGTGISLFRRDFLRVYGVIAAAAVGLFAIQTVFSPPLLVGVVLAGLASLAVVAVSRPLLQVAEVFPELLRFPLLRILVGEPRPRPPDQRA